MSVEISVFDKFYEYAYEGKNKDKINVLKSEIILLTETAKKVTFKDSKT